MKLTERKFISQNLSQLDEKVRLMLEDALSKARNNQDILFIEEWLLNPAKWRRPRVSVDTFLDSPYYLGVGATIYPEVRNICREIVQGKYSEGVVVGGIGGGKTTLSEILACYFAHNLLSLRNAHDNYGLTRDKSIAIMNMGISATQAQEVTFAGIRSMIARSPFFQEYHPDALASVIRFKNEQIFLMAGNSRSTTPLGYNIFYAILDEAAFYLDTDNRSVAEEIYTALQRRIVSRFGKDGLILMISSPRYVGDFIMKKFDEGKTLPGIVYTKQLPTWKMKKHGGSASTFFFNNRLGAVMDQQETPATIQAQGLTTNSLNDVFDSSKDAWEIPTEYFKSFKQNPEQAKRDFGAVPSLTLEAFFPNTINVIKAFKADRPNPVVANGSYALLGKPAKSSYYIHIDLALNKKGGDYGGLAMAHLEGTEVDQASKERRKKICVDLVERLEADPILGEVDFEKVRQKIYLLKDMGFNIALVTFDQFQSADSVQTLRRKGIKTELLSVDRSIEPYNTLKELFNEERISIHQQALCQQELCSLEIIKGTKVDHPVNGSKDLADALCGAVYNVITHAPMNNMGMTIGSVSYILPPGYQAIGRPTFSSVQQKVDYYVELERRNKLGEFV